MVVQHNLTAMNSNRMLGITTKTQSKSTEKLSSGYKINRAADDAAGLAISEKMRKQIRGLTQASLNAQDGISAVQTAEGALTEVHDMIQRMSELAVKAANGTNSDDEERSYIQLEIDELIKEIDRVAETTKFSNINLLKGDEGGGSQKTTYKYIEGWVPAQGVTLYDANGNVVKVVEADSAAAAANGLYTGFTVGAGGKPTSSGQAISGNFAAAVTIDSSGKLAFIEGKGLYDSTGTELDIDSYFTITGASGSQKIEFKSGINTSTTIYTTRAGDTSSPASASSFGSSKKTMELYDASGKKLSETDIIDKDTGQIKYTDTIYDAAGGNVVSPNSILGTYIKAETSGGAGGVLTLNFHVGAESDDANKISIDIQAMDSTSIKVDGISVRTEDEATAAIDELNEALQIVSEQRAKLGAIQNRLEHTVNNLDNIVENTTAAESQVRDTDMATEMVRYSNNNILAQAGQAMLAQSNQANQGVLSLLG